HRALSYVRRLGRSAHAEEGAHHRAPWHRYRHQDPAQGTGWGRGTERTDGRLADHLSGGTGPLFPPRGLDVIAPVPINIAQATLGSKIRVTTLDGKKIAIRIPPGTANGKRFRVRDQGIAKDGQKGDLIVQVDVQVPEKLTEEQEKAMKDFAEAGGLKY